MNGYFKPFRRRIGVVTLGLTCLVAAGWVRSSTIHEELHLRVGESRKVLASAAGSLRWVSLSPADFFQTNVARISVPVSESDGYDAYWSIRNNEWRWTFAQFDFGVGSVTPGATKVRIERWAIPYWSIVIPLTAISAWLLLSKPRAKVDRLITPAIENA